MSKRHEFVDDALEDKLRIGETILWIYGPLLILAGGGYVVAKCLVAEFGAAFVGFVATITGAGLVALCWLVFRMIRAVSSNAYRLERLRQRIDELELEIDAGVSGITAPQSQPPPQRLGDSADTENEKGRLLFEHALTLRDIETCRRLWPVVKESVDADLAAHFEKALSELEHETAESLRNGFAVQLREHEYATALHTGQRITELFPKSRMSLDFQSIRKRVESLAETATHVNNHSVQNIRPAHSTCDDSTEHANP
jgi:hypothetical protein